MRPCHGHGTTMRRRRVPKQRRAVHLSRRPAARAPARVHNEIVAQHANRRATGPAAHDGAAITGGGGRGGDRGAPYYLLVSVSVPAVTEAVSETWAAAVLADSMRTHALRTHALRAHALRAHALRAHGEMSMCRHEAGQCDKPTLLRVIEARIERLCGLRQILQRGAILADG